MWHLPVALDLAGRSALVVGSSDEMVSKVERLLDAGAEVGLVLPAEAHPRFLALASEGRVKLERRAAEDSDLEGRAIVFLAPSQSPEDEALARRWFLRLRAEGRLFCCVDRPEVSTFVNAAVVRPGASGLTITVATSGQSPGTSRRIREDLEALFADPRFERYLAALGRLRASLPRGERAARLSEAVRGFGIDAKLRFPPWLDEA